MSTFGGMRRMSRTFIIFIVVTLSLFIYISLPRAQVDVAIPTAQGPSSHAAASAKGDEQATGVNAKLVQPPKEKTDAELLVPTVQETVEKTNKDKPVAVEVKGGKVGEQMTQEQYVKAHDPEHFKEGHNAEDHASEEGAAGKGPQEDPAATSDKGSTEVKMKQDNKSDYVPDHDEEEEQGRSGASVAAAVEKTDKQHDPALVEDYLKQHDGEERVDASLEVLAQDDTESKADESSEETVEGTTVDKRSSQ